jgi:hypothetical protein
MLAGNIIFLENFRHLAPKKIWKFSVNSTKNAILFGKMAKPSTPQNSKNENKKIYRNVLKISLVYTCKQPQGAKLIYLLVNSCLSFFHLPKVTPPSECCFYCCLTSSFSLCTRANIQSRAVFVSSSSQICLCARRRVLLERFAADFTEVGAYSAPFVFCLLSVSRLCFSSRLHKSQFEVFWFLFLSFGVNVV